MNTSKYHILNNTDLMGNDWRFLEKEAENDNFCWNFFYGSPKNAIESFIRRPKIARYRACLETAKAAAAHNERCIIISHLPSMAGPTNFFRKRISPRVPQIAFSFNFTRLPKKPRISFRDNFSGIDEFVVFSKKEVDFYSSFFDIPAERFRFLPWAMEVPKTGLVPKSVKFDQFVCAIGGEGRDYAMFARAMAQLPHINAVVVARPYSIKGIRFSSNVQVFTNLPLDSTWAIVSSSLGVVIPLETPDTACGHITIVGTQLLGVPLVVTKSSAVADYVDEQTAQLVPCGDVETMIYSIEALNSERQAALKLAKHAQTISSNRNAISGWVHYLEDAVTRLLG